MKLTLFVVSFVALLFALAGEASAQAQHWSPYGGQGPVRVRIRVGDVHMSTPDKTATLIGHEIEAEGHGNLPLTLNESVRGAMAINQARDRHIQTAFNHVFAPQPIVVQAPPAPPPAPVIVMPSAPQQPAAAACCVHCGRTDRQTVLVWVEGNHWVCAARRAGNGFYDCAGHLWYWDAQRRVWLDP